jgi:hypothetical protein
MQIQMNSAELIKPVPNKILTIVRLFAKKSRTWLVTSILLLLGISQGFAANPQEVIQLLNQGLGINAKMKALEIFESSKNNEEKNNNIKLLLEVCMITTDNECFAKYWDTNWEGLYRSLNLMPKGTTEEKDRWNMTVDFLTAMYMYRLGFFPTEELVKQQLVYVKDRVTGATQYEYSSLRTVMEARAAASIGDRVLARKLIKRARALVLSRNLNKILEQLTLAYCLETSIYQLFDSQDARRLVKSFGQAGSESGINIEKYINPYVSLRVNRAILESGTQEPSARAVTADYLHVLYQNLQLPQKSTLLAQKESFYAYLALDKSWGNEIVLSFDPTTEFEKIIDPVNFDAIGVKAYLQAISSSLDDKNSTKIDEAIKLIEHLRNISDATTKRNFTPTYLILSSLKYRLQGDLQKEKRYLEDWVESQLDYFKFGGFNLLDQPPAMTGLIEKIVRYTVQRLIEIEPNSQALFRLTYFSIVTLNAKKDGDVTTSYALLQASGSDLKDRQIQDRIRLNADYSREITDAYYKSAKHLIENRTNSTFDGGVDRLATYQLLEKFKSSDQQLSELANKTNPFVNLDYKTLIPKDPDYSVILFAEADGYLLTLSLMKDSTKVQLLSLSKDLELSDSLSILTSKGLDKIPAEKIKIASVKFSRKIFGDFDLPPINRTSHISKKSITLENDGHENKQIQRRADHWFPAAGRIRHADQGTWAQARLQ